MSDINERYILTVGSEGGYLPNEVLGFDTLTVAREYARGLASDYRDDGAQVTAVSDGRLWIIDDGTALFTLITIDDNPDYRKPLPDHVTDLRDADKRHPDEVRCWIVATDKFMSGWGGADGMSSYVAIPADGLDWGTQCDLMEGMKGCDDMVRVRFNLNLPRCGQVTLYDTTFRRILANCRRY